MKTQTIQQLTKSDFLQTAASPLFQLFTQPSARHNDPPEVRAAWLKLYWKIVGKPGRASHRRR